MFTIRHRPVHPRNFVSGPFVRKLSQAIRVAALQNIETKPIKRKFSDRFAKKTAFRVEASRFLTNEEIKGFEALKMDKENISIFYPGSGNDILRPLMLLGNFKTARIILADKNLDPDMAAGYFSEITGCRNFTKLGNTYSFEFTDRTVMIECHEIDVLLKFPDINDIDVYFERAFQIFRQASPDFFLQVKMKLAKEAKIISDYGDIFGMEKIEVPEEAKAIGFYKNLGVYRFNGF